MRILRKIFASILILIVGSIALVGALVVSITSTYLNPDFYQSIFFKETVYELTLKQGSHLLLQEFSDVKEFLTEEEIEEQIRALIPAEFVGDTLHGIFDQIINQGNFDQITIDFKPIKEKVDGVVDNLGQTIAEKQGNSPQFNLITQEIKQTIKNKIPDQQVLSLTELDKGQSVTQAEQQALVYFLKEGTKTIPLALGSLIIVFLIVIGLIIWSPLSSVANWIGMALFSSGAMIYSIAIFLKTGGDIAPEAALILPIVIEMNKWALYFIGASILFYILHFIFKSHERT